MPGPGVTRVFDPTHKKQLTRLLWTTQNRSHGGPPLGRLLHLGRPMKREAIFEIRG